MYVELAGAAEQRVDEFNAWDLANTAALDKLQYTLPRHLSIGACDSRPPDVQLVTTSARAAERARCWQGRQSSGTRWAFAMVATAGQSDAQLFKELARAAEWRVGDFSSQQLANTAWA